MSAALVLADLPDEVCELIFARLKAPEVCAFRLTCRRFLALCGFLWYAAQTPFDRLRVLSQARPGFRRWILAGARGDADVRADNVMTPAVWHAEVRELLARAPPNPRRTDRMPAGVFWRSEATVTECIRFGSIEGFTFLTALLGKELRLLPNNWVDVALAARAVNILDHLLASMRAAGRLPPRNTFARAPASSPEVYAVVDKYYPAPFTCFDKIDAFARANGAVLEWSKATRDDLREDPEFARILAEAMLCCNQPELQEFWRQWVCPLVAELSDAPGPAQSFGERSDAPGPAQSFGERSDAPGPAQSSGERLERTRQICFEHFARTSCLCRRSYSPEFLRWIFAAWPTWHKDCECFLAMFALAGFSAEAESPDDSHFFDEFCDTFAEVICCRREDFRKLVMRGELSDPKFIHAGLNAVAWIRFERALDICLFLEFLHEILRRLSYQRWRKMYAMIEQEVGVGAATYAHLRARAVARSSAAEVAAAERECLLTCFGSKDKELSLLIAAVPELRRQIAAIVADPEALVRVCTYYRNSKTVCGPERLYARAPNNALTLFATLASSPEACAAFALWRQHVYDSAPRVERILFILRAARAGAQPEQRWLLEELPRVRTFCAQVLRSEGACSDLFAEAAPGSKTESCLVWSALDAVRGLIEEKRLSAADVFLCALARRPDLVRAAVCDPVLAAVAVIIGVDAGVDLWAAGDAVLAECKRLLAERRLLVTVPGAEVLLAHGVDLALIVSAGQACVVRYAAARAFPVSSDIIRAVLRAASYKRNRVSANGSSLNNSAAGTFGSSLNNSAAGTFGSSLNNSAAGTFGSADAGAVVQRTNGLRKHSEACYAGYQFLFEEICILQPGLRDLSAALRPDNYCRYKYEGPSVKKLLRAAAGSPITPEGW